MTVGIIYHQPEEYGFPDTRTCWRRTRHRELREFKRDRKLRPGTKTRIEGRKFLILASGFEGRTPVVHLGLLK